MEFTTQVDGVTVKGRAIDYTGSNIVVEITHPFRELTDGRHVPTFARGRESFFTSAKEEIALGLLERLYKIRHFLEMNQATLVAEYLKVTTHPDFPPHDGEARFFAKRRILKEQFRAGAITDQDYEREIGFARTLSHDLKSETNSILDAFFAGHFRMVISDELREQLILIFEEKS